MKDQVIAIIPARSGSKRLLNKNIMPFIDKPMLSWTIKAAIESKLFDYITVSTDSDEIADISKQYGAEVPFLRNMSDADDYTPAWIATVNALFQLESHLDTKFDVVVQLMPNCPLRISDDIVDAFEAFKTRGSNFQISVFKFGWMNPWWAMTLDKNTMRPTRLFPQAFRQRSQDQESLYCPSGAIWIAKADAFKKEKTFYGDGLTVHPMDWKRAIDIDDEDDLEMARMLAEKHLSS